VHSSPLALAALAGACPATLSAQAKVTVKEPLEPCWQDATQAADTIFMDRFSADPVNHRMAAPSGYGTIFGELPLLVELRSKQMKQEPACGLTVGFARHPRQRSFRTRTPAGMDQGNLIMLHQMAIQFKDWWCPNLKLVI
jgi:hypothetical protein